MPMRSFSLLLAVGALVISLTPHTARGQAPNLPLEWGPRAGPPGSARAYWTPERMRAARAMPIPIHTRGTRDVRALPTGPRGPATFVPGSEPGQKRSIAVPQTLAIPQPQSTPSEYFAYPYPFSSAPVHRDLYRVYPYSTNGRLFYRIPGVVGGQVCSGTVVTSGDAPRRALVVTAGHCVYSGPNGVHDIPPGVWSENLLFCPARRDDSSPFGCFEIEDVLPHPEWRISGNFGRDVAFLVTRQGPGGVGDDVGVMAGEQGIAWDIPPGQHYFIFGYQRVLDLTRMRQCTSAEARRDTSLSPAMIAVGCDMKRGASGGGWILYFKMSTQQAFINSVNSLGEEERTVVYGPYFDRSIGDLWSEARSRIRAPYDYAIVSQSPYPTIWKGGSARFELTVTNTGTATWYRHGLSPIAVNLGTDRPQDRIPGFIREDILNGSPSGWIRENRVIMQENAVPPGGTARFVFWMSAIADKAPGVYREYFRPVADGATWMRDRGIYWDVTVRGSPSDYRAQWVSQNPYPTLRRNQCYRFVVQFRNTGTAVWHPSVVRLGTDRPQDRIPGFIREDRCTSQPSGWIQPNRVILQELAVPPNSLGTFVFWYTVPHDKAFGTGREYFRPVADFVTWMDDWGVYWDVTVVP